MRDALQALVNAESPSSDPGLCAKAGRVLIDIIDREPDQIAGDGGREHYVWRWPGDRPVLMVGHLDTVWPAGTIDRWGFAIDGDIATGPGCYDMKCGLVVAAEVLSLLNEQDALAGVTLVVNSDEELGSLTSRALIEQEARGARAALILEPGHSGALKVARKGVGMYVVSIQGRAAHAGLEPELGVNALIEAAHQTIAIASLSDEASGTTVTPTMGAAGTARNVVPAGATIDVDVRVTNLGESERVDAALRALKPTLPGATLTVMGGPNRPPLERRMAESLYELALLAGKEIGFQPGAIEVGGGSDGNFTAAIGIPTIDGLGGDGGNAHAEGEWVSLSSLPVRAALVAEMIARLRGA